MEILWVSDKQPAAVWVWSLLVMRPLQCVKAFLEISMRSLASEWDRHDHWDTAPLFSLILYWHEQYPYFRRRRVAPCLLLIQLKIGELPQSTHTFSSLILVCHLVATIQSNLTKPSMFDEHLLSSYLSEFCTPWALTDARCDPGSKKQGPAHFPYLLRSHAQSCSIGSHQKT